MSSSIKKQFVINSTDTYFKSDKVNNKCKDESKPFEDYRELDAYIKEVREKIKEAVKEHKDFCIESMQKMKELNKESFDATSRGNIKNLSNSKEVYGLYSRKPQKLFLVYNHKKDKYVEVTKEKFINWTTAKKCKFALKGMNYKDHTCCKKKTKGKKVVSKEYLDIFDKLSRDVENGNAWSLVNLFTSQVTYSTVQTNKEFYYKDKHTDKELEDNMKRHRYDKINKINDLERKKENITGYKMMFFDIDIRDDNGNKITDEDELLRKKWEVVNLINKKFYDYTVLLDTKNGIQFQIWFDQIYSREDYSVENISSLIAEADCVLKTIVNEDWVDMSNATLTTPCRMPGTVHEKMKDEESLTDPYICGSNVCIYRNKRYSMDEFVTSVRRSFQRRGHD